MSDHPPHAHPPHRYTAEKAGEIETRWQRVWADAGTYRVPNPGDDGFDASRPKFYCLDMFPYPSGAGLHVGHPEGYTATDIISRYKRMKGFNVLHPMGFDAFGLPAEQHAINTGEHPAGFTRKTIDNFRRQLQRFGFCYDWDREYATIDEDYYRWTQWIFLQIYNAWFDVELGRARPIAELVELLETGRARVSPSGELVRVTSPAHATEALGGEAGVDRLWHELTDDERHAFINNQRLAYIDEQTVNWCPRLGTVLANEEVIDGRSERGGHPVLRKPLRQWLFRITAYAERLIDGLTDLNWPESTKTQQREWIGRSEGAEIDFDLANSDGLDQTTLRVYTTRPDTVFGATYMVVAPEHPLVAQVLETPREGTPTDQLAAYAEWAANRSDLERQESKDKTGCYTGIDAINPATGERIPVWTSDYVLMGYGFGAIMAVPAHDDRDFEFATNFALDIRQVVYPTALYPMWWLGTHTDAEALGGEDGWRSTVVDFMGLVSSAVIHDESEYESALETVLTRRTEQTETDGNDPSGRGSVRMIWAETLEDINIATVDEFVERMRSPLRVRRLGEAFADPGRAINSSNDDVSINGLGTSDAKARVIEWLERTGIGRRRINYRLRDWLFSRQRYWGEPFPIVFDENGHHHGVCETTLPVVLPGMDDYKPAESEDPQPLLGKATDWVNTTAGAVGVEGLDPDAPVRRETNTMPGWAGSCWYHIRYADRHNNDSMISTDADDYWLGENGVDLYVGGAEHAVLHLLYARFWHMTLHDLGHIKSPEPYRKLFHQGLITSHAFQRKDKSLVAIDLVEERDGHFYEIETGDRVSQTTAKMSKSLKNVVNPDDIIEQYGADTFRLYEMYMGPLEASKPWNTDDIIGLHRFLQRAWRTLVSEETGELSLAENADDAVEKLLHKTIAKVGADIERLGFNTAIAAMIEFINAASKTGLTRDQADRFVRTLAPFAPHISEELWHKLGHDPDASIALADWPGYDEAMLVEDEVEIPVQIKGKLRARIKIAADADQKATESAALTDERIAELLEGQTIRKVIVVPGKLVNIVAG